MYNKYWRLTEDLGSRLADKSSKSVQYDLLWHVKSAEYILVRSSVYKTVIYYFTEEIEYITLTHEEITKMDIPYA